MFFNILKRTVSIAIAIVMLSSTFTGSAATIRQTPTEGEVQTENVQGDAGQGANFDNVQDADFKVVDENDPQ